MCAQSAVHGPAQAVVHVRALVSFMRLSVYTWVRSLYSASSWPPGQLLSSSAGISSAAVFMHAAGQGGKVSIQVPGTTAVCHTAPHVLLHPECSAVTEKHVSILVHSLTMDFARASC